MPASGRIAFFVALSAARVCSQTPEPDGWFAGDPHVHCDCGVAGWQTVTPEQVFAAMATNRLSVVALLADMGNGEVRDAARDLPKINGKDLPFSTPRRILHWDAEWHYDPNEDFEHKVIGGHLILLGLEHGERTFSEYTYPVIERAKQQKAVAGYAHMQFLNNAIPKELDCCAPLEYPVETALHTIDFLAEDVQGGGDSAIEAYYRLLNCGFRPGLADSTDFPCNPDTPVGTQLTYVRTADGKLSYRGWIEGIAAGRTVISRDGHREFLDLKVNGQSGPGDEIALARPGRVAVDVKWSATAPLSGRVEIVRNGVVAAGREASGTSAALHATLDFPESGWICARRMDSKGHEVHTGAVYVTVNGAPVRASSADADFFVQFIDNLLARTSPGGTWNHFFAHELDAAQARYRRAREIYVRIAADARARGH